MNKPTFVLTIILFLMTPSLASGETSIRVKTQKDVTNYPLEKYVGFVLASEMPVDFPMEALKAQAVLIRTKALSPSQKHRKSGYDFCATTHCQAFHPRKNIPENLQVAVKQTKGQILSYGGKPIAVLYHSTCGGHTSPNHRVFGGEPLPYLQGVNDQNYCQESPHTWWQSEFSLAQLNAALAPSTLGSLQIDDGEYSGRNFVLKLRGKGSQKISTQEFLLRVGRMFGWEKLKSAYFEMKPQGETILFQGRGLGHGVGLCQWGAQGLARRGKSYLEILKHYFPRTRVKIYQRSPLPWGTRGANSAREWAEANPRVS